MAILGGHHSWRERGDVEAHICWMLDSKEEKKKQTKEILMAEELMMTIDNGKKEINCNHDSFHCKLQLMSQPLFNCISKVES